MIEVRLLGGVELSHAGRRLPDFPTHKSKALFALLMLNAGRCFTRERLIDLFWEDLPESRAKKCLSSDIWRIRSVIRSCGMDPDCMLQIHDHGIGLTGRDAFWLDTTEFEKIVGQAIQRAPASLTEPEAKDLEAALALYRGDLLEDLYDDWALVHRESMRAMYFSGLETLMQHYRDLGNPGRAIRIGRKLLALDPLAEHIHREIMQCCCRMGNRAGAIRQYRACAQMLRSELDIEPMHETQETYRHALAGGSIGVIRQDMPILPGPEPEQAGEFEDWAGIRRAMHNLQSAYSHLQGVCKRLHSRQAAK